jgi:hypothetical protein
VSPRTTGRLRNQPCRHRGWARPAITEVWTVGEDFFDPAQFHDPTTGEGLMATGSVHSP